MSDTHRLIEERNRIINQARGSSIDPNHPPPWLERSFNSINAELRRRGYDAPDDIHQPVTRLASGYPPDYQPATESPRDVNLRRLRRLSLRELRMELVHSQRSSEIGIIRQVIAEKEQWRDQHYGRGLRVNQVIVDEASHYGEPVTEAIRLAQRAIETEMMRQVLNPLLAEQQRGNNMEEEARVSITQPTPPVAPAPWDDDFVEQGSPDPWEAIVPTPALARKKPKQQSKMPVEINVSAEVNAIIEDAVGTRVAELKKNGYALLQQWIITGKLTKHASNVDDADFLAKNKKALMHITVIADEFNLTDNDLNAEDFIEVIKGDKPRFMQTQKEIRSVIEAKKANAVKSKVDKIMAGDNGFAQTMMKSFVAMETPKIHPGDQLKDSIRTAENNITTSVRSADNQYRQYLNYLTQAEEEAEQLKSLKAQFEAVKDSPATDMFANIRAFCLKADGVNFPFKFKYGYKENDTNFRLVFGKPAFTYKDPDSGVERRVAPLDIKVHICRDGAIWKYLITGSREDNLTEFMRYGSNFYSTDHSKYFHAHINTGGNICLGNAGDMIGKMRTNMDKIGDSLMIIDSLIKTYNPASPYQSMQNGFYADCSLLWRIANRFRDGDGGFQTALRTKLASGEITYCEYIKAMSDKLLQVLSVRMQYYIDQKISVSSGFDYMTECAPNRGYQGWSKVEKPFKGSADQETYFMDFIRDLIYFDNAIGNLNSRLYSLRPDLADKERWDIELMDFVLDYMKHHMDCFLRFIETAEINVEMHFKNDPRSEIFMEQVQGQNLRFPQWFQTKRKK